jgi:hypothetical protein
MLTVSGALASAEAERAARTSSQAGRNRLDIALLKYRGTLDESLKKQGIAVRWVEFPAGPQMLEGICGPAGNSTQRTAMPCFFRLSSRVPRYFSSAKMIPPRLAAGPRRPFRLRAGQSAGDRQHRLSKGEHCLFSLAFCVR